MSLGLGGLTGSWAPFSVSANACVRRKMTLYLGWTPLLSQKPTPGPHPGWPPGQRKLHLDGSRLGTQAEQVTSQGAVALCGRMDRQDEPLTCPAPAGWGKGQSKAWGPCAPHPSASIAGVARLCPNPHLPSLLTALQTRAPGKSHCRGMNVHPHSTLVCPGLSPWHPAQVGVTAGTLASMRPKGDADCSSHAKQARSFVEPPPTITPELEQGN